MYGTSSAKLGVVYDWGKDPAKGNPELHWKYHEPIYHEYLRVLKPGGIIAVAQGVKFVDWFRDWFGPHRQWALLRYRVRDKNVSGHVWIVRTKEGEPVQQPNDDNIIRYTTLGDWNKYHPCIKPVEELLFMVQHCSNRGDVVLDPCCGLGSTLLAAKKLHRHYIGCDLSPTYCSIAKMRLRTC
jgi:SAM-dependent methyltransferase